MGNYFATLLHYGLGNLPEITDIGFTNGTLEIFLRINPYFAHPIDRVDLDELSQ